MILKANLELLLKTINELFSTKLLNFRNTMAVRGVVWAKLQCPSLPFSYGPVGTQRNPEILK